MGEVFRARDTKLSRDVAIKVLPAPFAEGPERLARFEREARLLASPSASMIMGTAAYMSPEQARGKAVEREAWPVHKRADIWSFGVMLFEVLTGRDSSQGKR